MDTKVITFKEWESQAEYTPCNRFMSCGNEIQICSLQLSDTVKLYERTFYPWNFLKEPTVYWTIDLVLPISFIDKIKEFNGILSDNFYTDENFGLPEFDKLENAFNFFQWYELNNI